jgi:hypothetical protein
MWLTPDGSNPATGDDAGSEAIRSGRNQAAVNGSRHVADPDGSPAAGDDYMAGGAWKEDAGTPSGELSRLAISV